MTNSSAQLESPRPTATKTSAITTPAATPVTSTTATTTAKTTAAFTATPAATSTVRADQVHTAHRRAWGFLLAAAVFEVAFALGTKGSQGFTQLGWTLWTVVAALCGIFLLSQALKTLDVGIGYTVWTGIGSVGTVIIGTLLFDEPMTVLKALSFVAIIAGVLGLKLSSKPDASDLAVTPNGQPAAP